MPNALRIVTLCVVAAIVYGITLDQVTVRVCLEYFTIGHPKLFQTESPTLLALGWGVVATWWVGLLLGIPLAIAARRGNLPARTADSLVRPIARLLAIMAIAAFVAAVIGFALARADLVFLVEPMASDVPKDRHDPFIANLWGHTASYLVGFVGGAVLVRRVWKSRRETSAAIEE